MARAALPRGGFTISPVPVERFPIGKQAPDHRALQVASEERDETDLKDQTRAALVEAKCVLTEEELEGVVRDLRGIGYEKAEIWRRMVEMGRRLLRLQERVGEGGYKALRVAGLVPLSDGEASKLRAIARAVEDGKVTVELLPRSVLAAYTAARLPGETLQRMIGEGVLGPKTTAREIEQYAAAVSPEDVRAAAPGSNEMRSSVRKRLEKQLRLAEAKVADLRRRLSLGS
jgi:hypothetical protein